jgi:hypothetical protein
MGLGFTITKQGDIITEKGVLITEHPFSITEESIMETWQKDIYNKAAVSYNWNLRSGDLDTCNRDLGRATDSLKMLMLIFHFGLNGADWPGGRKKIVEMAKSALTDSGLETHEMRELYLGTIRPDTVPRPVMSVRDSLFLFELCLAGKYDEADEILARFAGGIA